MQIDHVFISSHVRVEGLFAEFAFNMADLKEKLKRRGFVNFDNQFPQPTIILTWAFFNGSSQQKHILWSESSSVSEAGTTSTTGSSSDVSSLISYEASYFFSLFKGLLESSSVVVVAFDEDDSL